MSKYNILWLDDEPIEGFYESDWPRLTIKHVQFVEEYYKELENNYVKYDAVILDANVKNRNTDDTPTTNFYQEIVVKTKEDHNLPTYIYSGEIQKNANKDWVSPFHKRHRFVDKENVFYKFDGPVYMLEKIIEDLDHNNKYYVGNEYLLDFFRKGWIDEKEKVAHMDQLMKWYSANEVQASYGNSMRQMLESMLGVINEKFALGVNGPIKNGWSVRVIKAIGEAKDKYDDNPFIIGFLYHIANFSNAQSHASIGEKDERKQYFDANFRTFFVVTKWFHELMLNFNDTPSSQHTSKPVQSKPITTEPCIEEPVYRENGTAYVKIKIPPKLNHKDKLLIKEIVPDVTKNGQWYIKTKN